MLDGLDVTSYTPASTGKPSQQKVHEVAPPPQDSQLVQEVAAVLATGAAIYVLAEGIEFLLKPFGIGRDAIMAALGIANQGTAAAPNARLAINGITDEGVAADAARAASRQELYYRAGYVINAARRISKGASVSGSLREAISHEAAYYRQHEAARRNRLDAAARVGIASSLFGDLLGWYLNPLLNNEAECIAADGHNFYASQGTVIGWPGAVHPHCGCSPGPAVEGAGMVNDAVAPVIRHIGHGKVFKLRRKAS